MSVNIGQQSSAVNQNVVVGNQPLVLTAVATSMTSSIDPSTGYRTDTAVTPLFTISIVTPPGSPGFGPTSASVIVVNPPLNLSGSVTSSSMITDPVTGVQHFALTTPSFSATATLVPGVPQPTLTITLTIG